MEAGLCPLGKLFLECTQVLLIAITKLIRELLRGASW